MEAGGAFQLDVRLQLTNGIKELCCGAQNRTEKSIPKRERESARECAHMRRGEADRENPKLHPDGTEPDLGLGLMSHEIMA